MDFTLIAWTLYFGDLMKSATVTCVMFAVGTAVALLFMAMGCFIDQAGWFLDKEEHPKLSAAGNRLLWVGGIAIVVACLLPSRTVIYAAAGGMVANAVADKVAEAPEMAKLRALINKRLDDVLGADEKK